MTASWDSFGAKPTRIRGGEIPPPSPTPWRVQRQAIREQIARATRQPAVDDAVTDGPDVAFRIGRLAIDADGLFALALMLPMLFIAQLGTLGGAVVAGLTPLYLYMRRRQLERVLLPRAFLFIIPAYAVFSVVWSAYPKDSLRHALEFTITVIVGLLLSSARNQVAVLRGLALAFLVYVVDAVLAGGTVAVGNDGSALAGLTDSKNLLADIASTGCLVSLACALMALPRRSWMWLGLGLAAAALDLYVVVAARSAGALLGLAMAIGPMLGLAPLIRAGRAVRAWLTCTLAVILVAGGLSYRWLAQVMIDLGATLFHKDSTLTGRTYLWYRASDFIREHPILGRGYDAFWVQGNIDAEGLWRYGGIDARSGFTFHNTGVEILVTLGWVGLILIAAVAVAGAVCLVRKFVTRPSLALVFWISFFLYEVCRTPIESLDILPFYFSTALMFGAVGAAFRRVHAPPRPARAPYVRPQVIAVAPVSYVRRWDGSLAPVRHTLRIRHSGGEAGR